MAENRNPEYLVKYRFGYYRWNVHDQDAVTEEWGDWSAKWCESASAIEQAKAEALEEFASKRWAEFHEILVCEIRPNAIEHHKAM